MVVTTPRRTFPVGRVIVGLILSIGIMFLWDAMSIRGIVPMAILWPPAFILGTGAAFGQIRYSVVTLILGIGLMMSVYSVSNYSHGWTAISAVVFFVLSWGMVWGRALWDTVNNSERPKKSPPFWAAVLFLPAVPGFFIRALLELILGRESGVSMSSSSVKTAPSAGGGLYFATLLTEGGCALLRTAVLYFPTLLILTPLHILVLMLTRDSYYGQIPGMFGPTNEYGIDNTLWLVEGVWLILRYTLLITALVGFSPVLLSLFHALLPISRSGASAIEMESLGAREPTRAEHTKIIDALQAIQARAGSTIAAPSHWRVIDEPVPDAYTIGSTVYLARGAIESPHLAGLMAHELGHIAHKDGDLILSLRRFIIPVAYYVGIDRHPMPAGTVVSVGSGVRQRLIRSEDEKIYYRFQTLHIKFWLAFWFGGMGLLLLGQHWAHFWRQRDFLADDYTVSLGFDQQLMEQLQQYRHVDVAQPFMLSNRPYTAERLDRLEG